MNWDFLPIPMSMLSLGVIGAFVASQADGKIRLHRREKDVLSHEAFQSHRLLLGASQQYLKPN